MSLIWLGNMEGDFRTYGDGGLNKPTPGRDSFALWSGELVVVISSTTRQDKCSIKNPVIMTLTRCVNRFCGLVSNNVFDLAQVRATSVRQAHVQIHRYKT